MSNPYNEALGATLIERTIRERIVIVGVTFPGSDEEQTDASLDELEALIDTAGADVVARLAQRRDHPDHTWFIGKGKAQELHELCLAVDADTVVFDNELSPAQQFNLEKLLGRTAIDRTAVILDIFAQNAHTLEGKPRSSSPCCATACPGCAAAPTPSCPSSAVASAPASVAARRSSRSTAGASSAASAASRPSSTSSAAPAPCSASSATAADSPR